MMRVKEVAMVIPREQRQDLERAARCGQPAYVRSKALVLLNLADGRAVREVARIFRVSRPSVYAWRERFLREGLGGLWVRSGRGRKPRADAEEIEEHLRQSPRHFGLDRTRWTLEGLAQVVPSLKGFTPYGVQKALGRAGFHYKRGQPSLHSPDPDYGVKKGLWRKP
jgi:transposase